MASESNRNIFLIIGALALIAIAYYIFIGRPNKEAPMEQTLGENPPVTQPTPPPPPFNAGDSVYMRSVRNMGIYMYPQSSTVYEVGVTTNLLNGDQPIGKFVGMTEDGNFVKVAMTNLIIDRKTVNPSRPDSVSYVRSPISGEYYVMSSQVKKSQY